MTVTRTLRLARTEDDVDFLVDTIASVSHGPLNAEALAGWRAATREQVAGDVANSDTFVLEHRGTPVGRVRVIRTPDRIELAGLQIRPEHQGRGIGTGVVLDLQAEATAAGLPFELRVEHTNARARVLYERLGLTWVADEEREALLRRAARPLVSGPDAEFRDPVLAALYDTLYGWGRDDQAFADFIGQDPGCRVLDLGCGTGRITVALAQRGHAVTGIDPAAASLERLRARPGAEAVTVLEGYADRAPSDSFEAALMSAHVAQFIVDDVQWAQALGHLHRALVPGGRLMFESRDPSAQIWKTWADAPPEWTQVSVAGAKVTIREWLQIRSVERLACDDAGGGAVVDFRWLNAIGEERELWSESRMRWRTEPELRESLQAAGFVVDSIQGGWDGSPPPHPDGEFIVRAHRD